MVPPTQIWLVHPIHHEHMYIIGNDFPIGNIMFNRWYTPFTTI